MLHDGPLVAPDIRHALEEIVVLGGFGHDAYVRLVFESGVKGHDVRVTQARVNADLRADRLDQWWRQVLLLVHLRMGEETTDPKLMPTARQALQSAGPRTDRAANTACPPSRAESAWVPGELSRAPNLEGDLLPGYGVHGQEDRPADPRAEP